MSDAADGKILVAGATGNTGRALVACLEATGASPRIMSRDAARAGQLFPKAEIVTADFADRASLAAAFAEVTRAYVVVNPAPDMVELYGHFAEAARAAGVAHLVKLSAFGASDQSASLLLRLHAQSDAVVAAAGVPFTILRPNSFFQNLLWSAGSIKTQGAFYLPTSATAKIAAIDVRDIAEAAAALLTRHVPAGRALTLTGPEALDYQQVAAGIARVAERDVRFVSVPSDAAEAAMTGMGLSPWLAHVLAEIQTVFATEGFDLVAPDIVPLLHQPPRRLVAFLADFASAFR